MHRLANVSVYIVQVLRRYVTNEINHGIRFGFGAVGVVQFQDGRNAAVRYVFGVFNDIDAELDYVAAEHFLRLGLLAALAEPVVVDERAVAALGVLQEKLAVLVPQQGVVSGQDFAIEDAIVRADLGFGQQPANLHRLIEGEGAFFERMRVGAALENRSANGSGHRVRVVVHVFDHHDDRWSYIFFFFIQNLKDRY